MVRLDGRGRRTVRRGVLDSPDSVAWAPDGRRLAFIALGSRSTNLATARLDGTELRTIATGETTAASGQVVLSDVTWSPRGGKIAYLRWTNDENGDRLDSELCLADPARGTAMVLARSHLIDELAWSSDGSPT